MEEVEAPSDGLEGIWRDIAMERSCDGGYLTGGRMGEDKFMIETRLKSTRVETQAELNRGRSLTEMNDVGRKSCSRE